MISDRTEAMLEHLSKQQQRLINYMVSGFVIGFIIGVTAAWLLMNIR